ncbi:MAG: CoA pyrophosphatase [Myxococcota bacterium]
MTRPSVGELQKALEVHRWVDLPALPGKRNDRLAAVLVPLVWDEGFRCVLTERSAHLREHPRQICFPGGRPEPEDKNLADTALREAFEEAGTFREAQVLGRLSSVPLLTSEYRLVPYVADVSGSSFVPNPDEVAEILLLELEPLIAEATTLAIPWDRAGERRLAPIFKVGSRFVFGGTAYALYELLAILRRMRRLDAPKMIESGYEWSEVVPR